MRHKRVALLLAVLLVLQFLAPAATAQGQGFADLNENHWVRGHLSSLEQRGADVFRGVPQDGGYLFQPGRYITRAEFSAILARVFGLSACFSLNPFTDVAQGAWYEEYAVGVVATGVVQGVNAEGTLFAPQGVLTRQEAFTMLSRICLNMPEFERIDEAEWADTLDRFQDVGNIADWAKEHIVLMVYHDMIQGILREDDQWFLHPTQNATRAEIAAMINGMLEPLQSEEVAVAIAEFLSQFGTLFSLSWERDGGAQYNLDNSGGWFDRNGNPMAPPTFLRGEWQHVPVSYLIYDFEQDGIPEIVVLFGQPFSSDAQYVVYRFIDGAYQEVGTLSWGLRAFVDRAGRTVIHYDDAYSGEFSYSYLTFVENRLELDVIIDTYFDGQNSFFRNHITGEKTPVIVDFRDSPCETWFAHHRGLEFQLNPNIFSMPDETLTWVRPLHHLQGRVNVLASEILGF